MRYGIAFFRTHANAICRLQVAALAETIVHANEYARRPRRAIGAGRRASGTALLAFGVSTAFARRRR